MGRLYDAYIEVGPRFAGFGDIEKQGQESGKKYGEALAKAAAKAAEANVRRLGEALAKARSAEADAAGKVRVAEAKLNEVRADSKAKASQIAAAEESLATAQRKSASAADTAKTAAQSLDKAREQVAKSADGVGAKTGNRFSDAFKRVMSKRAEKDGSDISTRFGLGLNGAFGGIVSRSAGLFVAGFAAVQGAQIFSGFINDARESEKVSRITANAIKTTGGAAKITADQVGDLATAISNKTGIDDEQVQTASNMLLTFKNIRNEAGKNNDVFNQATQAAADLSVQFGGIDGASKQLGKALNDPVKGMTALAKSGVTFTEQQKEQIKTLVKSGDTLGAQKIILKEIQAQVGGAAAAATDPMQKLTVIGGNLAEKFGGVLLPTINKFATFLGDKAAPALGAVIDKVSEFTASKGFQEFLADVETKSRSAFGFFRDEVLPRLRDVAGVLTGTLLPAAKSVFGFFAENKGLILGLVAAYTSLVVVTKLHTAAMAVQTAGGFAAFLGQWIAQTRIAAAATKAWAAVQWLLNVALNANPIGLLVIGLAALIGGLVLAYRNSDQFRKVVDTAFRAVRAAAVFMWDNYLKPMFANFVTVLKGVWLAAQTFARITSAAWGAIKEPARIAIKYVVDTFLNMVSTVLTGASKAFGWVPELGDKLKGASEAFGKFRDDVNKKLDGINDEPVDIKVGLAYTQALGQKTKQMKFAAGGIFPGYTPGRDIGSVAVSGGEAIMRPEWTKAVGSGYVDAANSSARSGGVQGVKRFLGGFASGGVVLRSLLPGGERLSALASAVSSSVDQVGSKVAQAIAKQLVAGRVNPGLSGALGFARSQAGKPYVWGGVGPNGYDCSGFMSAITNAILGRGLHSRLFATGSFPTSMFARGMGAFSIGSRRGNPGHMAGTLNGVDVESRGGEGVVVGSRARGAGDSLFGGNIWHLKGFASGGVVGDAPFDLLNPRGKSFLGLDLAKALGIRKYDTGGPWPPGTFGYNGTGKTETVRTAEQEAALGGPLQIRIYVGDREISDIARVEVDGALRDMAIDFGL